MLEYSKPDKIEHKYSKIEQHSIEITTNIVKNIEIDNKIDYLYRLIEEVPESVYRPQALFEIASSYFEVENYQMALDVLKELEDNYPNSTLIADTYL